MKTKRRVYILVKAYPQPSQRYEETVCCAGISEQGEFVRLYPVRYRRLKEGARFERYDLVELEGERPRDDHRPESFHIDEDSIRVLKRGRDLRPESRASLWLPLVSASLPALRKANEKGGTSLGIVRPDPGSVRFNWKKANASSAEDKAIGTALFEQASLLEEPLVKLTPPEFAFYYAYTSEGVKSEGQIHDWEVQATHYNYKKLYGSGALEKMRDQYQHAIPDQNLHLILGTMKAHPKQFIIIGLLRVKADVEALKAQRPLF